MANYDLISVGRAIGEGLADMGSYSAQAAAQANSVSAAAQAAQGQFNQQSANLANAQNVANMMNQYQYNSAQASAANQFTETMWQRAADWNEAMWQKQADFNAEQAEIQRNWQERMANTQYQRAVSDMEKAGLNPILAVTGGGVGTSVPGGSTASVGGSSMSSAQGAMASGGLIGANSASESNYMGQMEYLSGTLGLISACISGLSTAAGAAGSLGDVGEGLMETVSDQLLGGFDIKKGSLADKAIDWTKATYEKAKNYLFGETSDKTKTVYKNYDLDKVKNKQRGNNWYRFHGEIKG